MQSVDIWPSVWFCTLTNHQQILSRYYSTLFHVWNAAVSEEFFCVYGCYGNSRIRNLGPAFCLGLSEDLIGSTSGYGICCVNSLEAGVTAAAGCEESWAPVVFICYFVRSFTFPTFVLVRFGIFLQNQKWCAGFPRLLESFGFFLIFQTMKSPGK